MRILLLIPICIVGFLLCLVAALFDSLGLVWFAHHIERAENWLARIFLKLQLP